MPDLREMIFIHLGRYLINTFHCAILHPIGTLPKGVVASSTHQVFGAVAGDLGGKLVESYDLLI